MAGKESNPIQQRIDLLVEKWEAVAAKPGIHIVRIHAEENEKDMVDAFYMYLLGVDTQNNDIPVIFESVYENDHQYTKALLDELKELIHIWNTANKDSISIKTEPINWEPDYTLIQKDNPAYLFIENMNRLAAYLKLDDTVFLVAVLKISILQSPQFNTWLEFALKAGFSKKLKFLIDDNSDNPFYEKIALKYPETIATLRPQLDMDNAMQQIAAMGNPNDPTVQYRKSFIALTQAIGKRKEKDAEKHAGTCTEIALKNLEKNPYWIGQLIAVNAALANDQIGYKNYKKAIGYATEGVKAAEGAADIITDEFIYRKFVAQAIMLRASLYAATKNWNDAIADFSIAAEHYSYTNDMILAVEAWRMLGFCYDESGNTDEACKALSEAVSLSKQLPAHIIQYTTFAGIIELLLKINNQKYISDMEIHQAAEGVYGKEWLKEVMNWKNPHYEPVTEPEKAIVA
jgi:tetratricopeptide (TPR) repeat protein